ncbi:ABC transporter substrate-binding protein [uncultured Legionella sp.]|uniref:ABC transporter substrate-binding protein n=1 Tax=uncultured Legionella sp. TaxID=210934 RepID=UPI0026291E38|nr:ABC transporter substrate-binding protein [uncultured Legionella sp.]
MSNVLLNKCVINCALVLSMIWGSICHAVVDSNTIKANKKTEINVGIYAPFSDKSAFIGRNILAAMEMARDQFKSSQINYAFYTLDVLPSKGKVLPTLQKFIDAHHINVLITEGTENGALIAPLATQNNILHFSMASDSSIADGINNFLAWSPAYEQAAVLIKELRRKKVKQIAIITTRQPSFMVLTQSVMKQIQAHSTIKISAYQEVKANETNFSGVIQKMEEKNPDLYLIMASPEEIGLIHSQMLNIHVDKPITSIVDRVTPTVMRVFDGQWYIDAHEMKPEFIKRFKEEYFNHPVTEAGYAYDVFQILNKGITMAMKIKHEFSSEEVARQIHSLAKGVGVMGPFSLGAKGVLLTQSEIKTIRNGQVLTG